VKGHERHVFVRADIADRATIRSLLASQRPQAVLHLAAESHVDRSIDGPAPFVETNVVGTFCLLEECLRYWESLSVDDRDGFRFHHVSTDEVFGDLGPDGEASGEGASYAPGSPYAASKAAADHFVAAWQRTYGLPVVLTNCSNNYGPFQLPEKLVPLLILNAIEGRVLPLYGDGQHVRDWLFVDDHVRALWSVVNGARPGTRYNIGGRAERTNLEVAHRICDLLDELRPERPAGHASHRGLIEFVRDRPGHDRRYALDPSGIERDLGWSPRETFDSGMRRTVEWYVRNLEWCRRVQDASSRGRRLGLERDRD
jgi:dTDP-glucose 4,6-dehydratase